MVKITFIVILLFSLLKLVKPQSKCTITDQAGRNIEGVCRDFSQCPSAISDYSAGINPQRSCGSSRKRNIICCQTGKRISEKKCEKYSEVLQTIDGPKPFIGIDEVNREIICPNSREGFIIGGRPASPVEFPHMVALGWITRNETQWRCGGTLLSPKYVLTAAHCTITKFGPPTVLLLGDIYLKNQNEDPNAKKFRKIIKVSQIFNHPDYNKKQVYNDIAIIELETELKLRREIFPACLPQPSLRLDKIKVVNATGWGILGYGEDMSNVLQGVNLERTSLKECNKYYEDAPDRPFRFPNGITRNMMCAIDSTGNNKDTCNGDSGGPLTVNKDHTCLYYVIGVTSFGPTLCGHGTPGVYTNVHSYLDWIENIVWPYESSEQ